MKRLCFLLAICVSPALAQWADFSSQTAASNLSGAMNGKINLQISAGSCPSLAGTAGRDNCWDSTNSVLYHCKVTGTPCTWAADISADGSYSNPSWITQLAWSKISGAPVFLQAANNLSDLASAATARTNLGLGGFAVLNNPMTTAGDFLIGGASGVPARLAVPSNGTWCMNNATGTITWVTCPGAAGGLTSVGLTMPTGFTVTGSPLTSNGTLAVTLASQSASFALIAPTAGGVPTFRAIVAADIPTLNQNTTGNAATATALQGTPTLCSTGNAPTGILANGNATGCAPISGGSGNAAQPHTVTPSAGAATFACTSGTAGTTEYFRLNAALSASITSSTLTGCTDGQHLDFVFKQAASGGPWTVAMPTGFSQACQVSPIANAQTKMDFVWDAGSSTAQLIACSTDSGPAIESTQAPPATNPPSGKVFNWADSTDNDSETKDSSGNVYAKFLKGGDANPITGQVTVTHLASPLPTGQGGLGNTTGQAATALALAATPTLCSTGMAPTGVLANGNATGCASIGSGSGGTGGGGASSQTFTSATSVSVPGLGVPNVLVGCVDAGGNGIAPSGWSVSGSAPYNVTVTFSIGVTGTCTIVGMGRFISSLQSGTTWTLTAGTTGFGTAAMHVMVYDNASPRHRIEPDSLTIDPSTFQVVATFAQPQSGYVVIE